MIFTQGILKSCKSCDLLLSDSNATGFCTHFCEDNFNGRPHISGHNSMAHVVAVTVDKRPWVPPVVVKMPVIEPTSRNVFEYDDSTPLHVLRTLASRQKQAKYKERHNQ